MIPTLAQVYTATRGVLGDTKKAAGEVYTDAILQPHYIFSFSELFRALQSAQNPKVRRENYYNVPALTGYLSPATAGIFNMGEPESLEERKNITSWSILTFVANTGYATITTSTPTTLVSGNQAVIFGLTGVSDDVNDVWTVTVVNSTTLQLMGCTATVTGTVGGGTVSFSAENFTPMSPVQRISWQDQNPTDRFQVYAWEGDIFRFPPSNTQTQVRITYSLSGDAPLLTTQSVGIDDSLGILSYRMASLASYSKGMVQRAAVYRDLAVGPKWDSDQMPGGILYQLLLPGLRNLQRLPPSQRRSPPFGRSRGRRWGIW